MGEKSQDIEGSEPQQESNTVAGFLPDNIVQMLAAREKQVLLSDTNENEDEKKHTSARKASLKPVVLSKMSPPPCLLNALEVSTLERKKMSVPSSSAVLNNYYQVFRLLSRPGARSQK